MSSLATIFYEDAPHYIHVAHDTATDSVYIEVDDEDGQPNAGCHIPYEQAVEMATRILSFGNWPDRINRRDMAARSAS